MPVDGGGLISVYHCTYRRSEKQENLENLEIMGPIFFNYAPIA